MQISSSRMGPEGTCNKFPREHSDKMQRDLKQSFRQGHGKTSAMVSKPVLSLYRASGDVRRQAEKKAVFSCCAVFLQMMCRMQRTACQSCVMLQQDGEDRKLWLQQQDLDSSGTQEYKKNVLSWKDSYKNIKKLMLLTCRKQLVPH